jgi:hypothetical protein
MENWADYIHKNFNGSSEGPGEGNFSIQLLLGWSVVKIVVMSLTPVILSLAIGTYYQKVHQDVGTAWVISTYIVAAAASKIQASQFVLTILTCMQFLLLFLGLRQVLDEFNSWGIQVDEDLYLPLSVKGAGAAD